MKAFLTALGIIILSFTFVLYQQDMDSMLEVAAETKYEANSLANWMALYYDTEEFGEGRMVLNDAEIMEVATTEIDASKYRYEISVIDDLGTLRYYRDGVLVSSAPATLPYLYQDSSGYQVTIVQPSVIVTLTRPGNYFKALAPEFDEIVRTSNYSIQPRSLN